MSLAGIPQETLDAIDARGRAVMLKFYELAEARSFYRQEIVFRRCERCGAQEHLSPAGRLVMEHDRTLHFGPLPGDSSAIKYPLSRPARVTRPFGERD